MCAYRIIRATNQMLHILLASCLLHVLIGATPLAVTPKAAAPKPAAPLFPPAPPQPSLPSPPNYAADCPLENECAVNATTEAVCRYDPAAGCIRKYASACHLEIAACRAGKRYTDGSSDYCAMEAFLCEEGYERWSIFFGHEKP